VNIVDQIMHVSKTETITECTGHVKNVPTFDVAAKKINKLDKTKWCVFCGTPSIKSGIPQQPLSDHTQILNLSLDDQTIFYKSFN
jgi:hypothetical protein